MGRGLSQQQLDILGLACSVNTRAQNGVMRVKEGAPVPRYTVQTNDSPGPKDITVRLALWGVAGIRPSAGVVGGWFDGTKEYKKAKASITRAITRLTERKMLILAPIDGADHRWGYVLTRDGLSAGRPWAREIPGLDLALRLFGMQNARFIEPTFDGDLKRLRAGIQRGHISHILTDNGIVGRLRDHRIKLLNQITDNGYLGSASGTEVTDSDNGYHDRTSADLVADSEVPA